MDFLLLSILAVVVCFSFVVLFGAPYVPTLKPQRQQALKMLNLKAGQTLIELGCGDGTILAMAGKQNIKCIGYELNPILVLVAKFRTRRYRNIVKIKWGNFWSADISKADGVYVFLLDRLMPKLEYKVLSQGKANLKIVSYTFEFPNIKPKKYNKALFYYQITALDKKTLSS